MKKLICILLSVMTIIGLCACGSSGGTKEDPTSLLAGFAREVCLPDDAIVYIAGGTASEDPSTDGVLDEIMITCIALKQNGRTILVYTCDVVDIESFYTGTETVISEATGIPASDIILNATHTHSAPTLKNNLPGKDAYLAKFNSVCATVGKAAIADLSPAALSYGSIMTEKMVRIRHYWMNDGTSHGNGHGSAASGYKEHMYPADEECQVLRLTRAADDKKDIVMMNLGAHATKASSIAAFTHMLSADFPGYARAFVEENADVHCAYFIAASGDQVPSSRIPGEVTNSNNLPAYGEQLGQYVLDCLNNMTEAQGNTMRLYTEDFVAKKKAYGAYQEGEIVSIAQSLSFPTNTMTIGDVGLVFFPGELFGTQGRQLKDNSPMALTFVITNSEGDQMYFANAIAEEHSFYEYDISKYAVGAGEAAADRYCEILTALKDGKTPEPQKTQP